MNLNKLRKFLTVDEAAHFLKKGEIVAFPTETVYGLGASVFDDKAIKKIFQAKGRPQDNPLIVHLADVEDAKSVSQNIPAQFYRLAEVFMPGPLTILLPKRETIPASVSAGLPTIGVRIPDHPVARSLIREAGMPLAAPSANLSGKPSSTTAEHVFHDFEGKIAGVLDGGPSAFGLESTVLSLSPKPVILRPGMISKEQLEQVLEEEVFFAKGETTALAPGMKYRHYAPNARIHLVHSSPPTCSVKQKIVSGIRADQLYAQLREADLLGIEELFIVIDEKIAANTALMNRLEKAANPVF